MFHDFLWYSQNDFEYLTLNKKVRQLKFIVHVGVAVLSLLFFVLLSYIFPSLKCSLYEKQPQNSLCFVIKSILRFKSLSIYLGKSKWIVFGSVIIMSLLFFIITPIVITSWLHYHKMISCFYCVDTNDIVFASFCF